MSNNANGTKVAPVTQPEGKISNKSLVDLGYDVSSKEHLATLPLEKLLQIADQNDKVKSHKEIRLWSPAYAASSQTNVLAAIRTLRPSVKVPAKTITEVAVEMDDQEWAKLVAARKAAKSATK